jgi:hypothetical protein
MAQAYGKGRCDDEMATVGMIYMAFFLLLHPGQYTGTISEDAAFKLQGVHLYIQNRHLDSYTASEL